MASHGEILSPVGNMEMLIAAVRSGADAVYMGAKDFSARRNAENFTLPELKEAIEYCHIRGVKAYLTLNILVKEREMEKAFSLAQSAYNMGIDGIIVQDPGLARVLHKLIPKLPLHASTQMSVHSPAALTLLQKMGFCQVVAAREMSKEELKVFCQKAKELNMVVEVFVHGALCMSVSGQCQLSAVLGGRSGNRGLCAGPCRLPFAVSGGTGYDLSLKDLSLLEYITELYDMGVGSFKIEGRMKRPEYVAAATAACRQALDKGVVDFALAETLKNVFSRSGFTAGYYENKLGKNMFGVRTKEDVVSADKAFPALHEIYRNERQSVKISVTCEVLKDKPISLTLNDGVNTVTAVGDIPEAAKSKAVTNEYVLKNITKFGSTPYIDEGGVVRLGDGLFVSAGALNALRREAVEMLNAKRAEVSYPKNTAVYEKESVEAEESEKQKVIARFSHLSQIPKDLRGIDAVLLPAEADFADLLEKKVEIIAEIPRFIVNEQRLEKHLCELKAAGISTAYCENLSAVALCKGAGFKVIAGAGLNIANSESAAWLKENGIDSALISVEEELSDIKKIGGVKKGIAVYGHLPLMLLRNCPMKNGGGCKECKEKGKITDRKGVEFALRCREGYTELLNSNPLWLMDKKEDFVFAGFVLLYFTTENRERAEEVLGLWGKSACPDTDFTRGLYYRGTL